MSGTGMAGRGNTRREKGTVPFSVAIGAYDRTAPLLAGEVGGDLPFEFVAADTQESTFGMLEGRYDAGEMSLATYAKVREESDRLQAIAVFTHRKFFHPYVWTRRGSRIRSLADLRGRRVIVPMYWMTSSVWHRMILEDEAGVRATELEWHVVARDRLPSMTPPAGVVVREIGRRSIVEMLESGDADAILHAATVPELAAARGRLERPFVAGERRFFERTGYFPPVHAIVLRREILDERPDDVARLARAVDESKRLAYARLEFEPRTTLPFIREHLEEMHRLFAGDPYPDGLEANQAAIAAFATALHTQGLTARRLEEDELFAVPAPARPR
jgi:4,5-dihydroxyphthalate decarboxylase